jgi:hypothetical protein
MAQPLPGKVVRRNPLREVEEYMQNIWQQNNVLEQQIRVQERLEYDRLTEDQIEDMDISSFDDFRIHHIDKQSPELQNLKRQRRQLAIEMLEKREEQESLIQKGWKLGGRRKSRRRRRKHRKLRKTRR